MAESNCSRVILAVCSTLLPAASAPAFIALSKVSLPAFITFSTASLFISVAVFALLVVAIDFLLMPGGRRRLYSVPVPRMEPSCCDATYTPKYEGRTGLSRKNLCGAQKCCTAVPLGRPTLGRFHPTPWKPPVTDGAALSRWLSMPRSTDRSDAAVRTCLMLRSAPPERPAYSRPEAATSRRGSTRGRRRYR